MDEAERTARIEAFDAFVRAQQRPLQRTAWLLAGDWSAAQDLVQAALLAAWRNWERVSGAQSPDAYVRRILVNSFLSGRQRRWTGEIPSAELPVSTSPFGSGRDVDLQATLRRALDRLPGRQRAVVALRYFDDLTETQVAQALDCSVGTVKAHAHKAMRTLRESPELADLLTEGVYP